MTDFTSISDAQAMSVLGGLFGGALVGIVIFLVALCVFMIIVSWKIFTKAGVAGWKCLIPIYNVYCFCKIIDINFWVWVLALPIALGVVTGIINNTDVKTTISSLYEAALAIYMSYKLGKAFNKSTAFIVGLILLAPIFEAILAFDSSKYVGTAK